jgi:putative Mg2+ transporter-C (MgtC) family protein
VGSTASVRITITRPRKESDVIDDIDLVARLGVALACGLALGAEREARSKVAGIRTHGLVAVGAALFAISGAYGIEGVSDPTRVAAQVASGIGFIGAGAIMRSGFNITGVTTASTLWLAAALGVAAGFGLYVVSLTALAMALILVVALGPLMSALPWSRSHRIELRYHVGHGTLGPLFAELAESRVIVRRIQLDEEPDGVRHVELTVSGGGVAVGRIVADISLRDEMIRAATRPL